MTDLEKLDERIRKERDEAWRAGARAAIQWVKDDASRCDCFALDESECACGAWVDYKKVDCASLIRQLEDWLRSRSRKE